MTEIVGVLHKNCIVTYYEAANRPAADQLAAKLLDGSVSADIPSPVVRTWVLSEVEAGHARARNAAVSDRRNML